jgi:hypothetical protein
MSTHREHADRQTHEEEVEDSSPSDIRDNAAEAHEASERAQDIVDDIDALLDDVDQSLRRALGLGVDENVDADEWNRRAAEMVAQYQQKGGQ